MPATSPDAALVARVYDALAAIHRDETWHWDSAHGRGPMDIIAGAVLVQHTTWTNAERALNALRDAGALDAGALIALPDDRIAALVRVSGTPTVKARRLRAVAETIVAAGGIDTLMALPRDELRERLLATHGIGPETADAIALYAAGARTFIIDAYTRRLFSRIGGGPGEGAPYAAWQRWFEDVLPAADAAHFQRFHAYIVLHAKAICAARPRCGSCALRTWCRQGSTG